MRFESLRLDKPDVTVRESNARIVGPLLAKRRRRHAARFARRTRRSAPDKRGIYPGVHGILRAEALPAPPTVGP